jgi:hypothetical protein
MSQKWLVGHSTRDPKGAFKTKREAIDWALDNLTGIFIVWKAELSQAQKERNGVMLRASHTGENNA